jgi:hypothetical protein
MMDLDEFDDIISDITKNNLDGDERLIGTSFKILGLPCVGTISGPTEYATYSFKIEVPVKLKWLNKGTSVIEDDHLNLSYLQSNVSHILTENQIKLLLL